MAQVEDMGNDGYIDAAAKGCSRYAILISIAMVKSLELDLSGPRNRDSLRK